MKFQINKPDKKKYIIQSVVAVLIVAVAIIADLVSKTAVVDACIADGMSATGSYHKLSTVMEGFFYITYTQNTGGAWSIGGGSSAFMTIVIILTFIAVTLFLFILFFPDSRKNTFFIISLSLIAGGATGNLVDRLAFGYVRDFLSFYPFGQSFPIFNIADVCLVIGVIMMVVCIIIMFFKPKKKEVESERVAEKESLE